MESNSDQSVPGFVALDDIALGGAYVLDAGEGQHLAVHGSVRTLMTRGEDTDGTVSVTVNWGDTSPATVPHYHRHTTEFLWALDGVTRVWLDDTKGVRFARDLQPGGFVLLPIGWIHAWAFAAPGTRYLAGIAPAGFEKILSLLNPAEPTTLEMLRETEKTIDVVWTPECPLFGEDDEQFIPPVVRDLRERSVAAPLGS